MDAPDDARRRIPPLDASPTWLADHRYNPRAANIVGSGYAASRFPQHRLMGSAAAACVGNVPPGSRGWARGAPAENLTGVPA